MANYRLLLKARMFGNELNTYGHKVVKVQNVTRIDDLKVFVLLCSTIYTYTYYIEKYLDKTSLGAMNWRKK